MPNPQKQKGNNWERSVADFLTSQYGEKFLRAPGSGAYIGGANSHRKQILSEGQIRTFKGDIIPGPSFDRLNIECKSYKSFGFHQLLSGTTNKLLENWIEQAVGVADKGDLTVLFIKITHHGTFIATPAQEKLILPPHGTRYNTQHYGTWFFSDLKTFFELNKQSIRELSETISQ